MTSSAHHRPRRLRPGPGDPARPQPLGSRGEEPAADPDLSALLADIAERTSSPPDSLHALYELTVGELSTTVSGWGTAVVAVDVILVGTYVQVWNGAGQRPPNLPVMRWLRALALGQVRLRATPRPVVPARDDPRSQEEVA